MNGVVIVAGGKGTRMGGSLSKQYMMLGEKSILGHTVEKFQMCKDIDQIVIVVGKDDIRYCQENIVEEYGFDKVTDVVAGGVERQFSVYNGLKALDKNTDIVLVHDGVRPFVKIKHILKIIGEAKKFGGCVLGVKVKDTIKVCDADENICDTPERESLWIAQTPQAFKFEVLKKAYEKAFEENVLGTDDSMIVERTGHVVKMVEGDYDNIKITTHEDLNFGMAILNKKEQ